MTVSERTDLCNRVEEAKIFVAERKLTYQDTHKDTLEFISGNFPYDMQEFLYITSVTHDNIYASVQTINLFYRESDQENEVTSLSCKVKNQQIFIGKHSNYADYLLIGKKHNEHKPRLLAIIAPYLRIINVGNARSEVNRFFECKFCYK